MRNHVAIAGLFLLLCFADFASLAQPPAPRAKHREDQILVMPKTGVNVAELNQFHLRQQSGVLKTFHGIRGLQIVHLPPGESVASAIARYQQSGLVEFAEPDYEVYAQAVPNDPYFANGKLWALNNYGQNGGTAHADIAATNAWDILTSASNIVVAVVDTGIRYTHEDLASNMWVNPTDGSHGWNALTSTNDPFDDSGHGTAMASVLGASGNNNLGIVGVAWQVQLMGCKCLNGSGVGTDSDLIACFDYARTNGARIINASLGSSSFSLAVSNAVAALRDAGIILVAAAGNSVPPNPGSNMDTQPVYPAAYDLDNIISVAYSTRNDALGQFSYYGATNVDLAAPGEQIYTATASSDSSYLSDLQVFLGQGTGTSSAAAFVSGACALLWAQYPADNYQGIINRLLSSTDSLPALAGKCRTGGRLNLYKAMRTTRLDVTAIGNEAALALKISGGLNRVCILESSTNLFAWSPVFTNTTGADGTFAFTNNLAAPSQFFRASAAP